MTTDSTAEPDNDVDGYTMEEIGRAARRRHRRDYRRSIAVAVVGAVFSGVCLTNAAIMLWRPELVIPAFAEAFVHPEFYYRHAVGGQLVGFVALATFAARKWWTRHPNPDESLIRGMKDMEENRDR